MSNDNKSARPAEPLLLGNGDLCLMTNEEGMLPDSTAALGNGNPLRCVFRAGRRMYINVHRNIQGNLLPFGHFSFDCGAPLEESRCTLSLPDGIAESTCRYRDGSTVDSEFFVCFDKSLYAIRKTYHGNEKDLAYTFCADFESRLVRLILASSSEEPIENGLRMNFCMEGMDTYRGNISVFLDRQSVLKKLSDDTYSFTFHVKDGDRFCFFYALSDDADGNDPAKEADALHREAQSFDSLLSAHKALWRAYFAQGYIRTDDEEKNKVYNTALYHFKCITTKWSIPVGLCDSVWHGNYFAFDEYYGFYGLLSSGRLSLAKRVPAFRVRNCLKKALARSTNYSEPQARFMWETTEYGDENSPFGPWFDHVFHMAVAAQGAFEYYEFSNDLDFLSECYDMIRACAEFFSLNMLYRDEKRGIYFGKCTDLERIGSPVENAFMSCCGAIATFRVFARAAEILGKDEKYRAECLFYADELLKNLARDDEKYLPFPKAELRSIGVFAGKFPFNVLDGDDPLLHAAFCDYTEHEETFGNMYRVGKGVSSWYAAWKAEAYARCGRSNETSEALSQARASKGKYDELFEINEENVYSVPWFMTAAGVYVSAVNESILQSDGENVFLLPASGEKNISFKLPVKSGAVCEAEIRDGLLKKVDFTFREGVKPKKFSVFLHGNKIEY